MSDEREILKPCPFCGNEPRHDHGMVYCDNPDCGATIGEDEEDVDEVAAWNLRSEPMGEQRTEVYDGVRGLFCHADAVPDVVMVNGERYLPVGEIRYEAQGYATQVVVGREEWERMERDHLAMEAMRTNLAPRFAWIFDGFDLKQGSQDVGHNDPADAILGTNGGGE